MRLIPLSHPVVTTSVPVTRLMAQKTNRRCKTQDMRVPFWKSMAARLQSCRHSDEKNRIREIRSESKIARGETVVGPDRSHPDAAVDRRLNEPHGAIHHGDDAPGAVHRLNEIG